MKRTGRDVEQIYDVIAFRVITESVRDCYGVLGVVHSTWTPVPGRFKDYIALPKPNLYQSLHTTVIGPRAERIEVQIRTAGDAPHRRARHRRALEVQGGQQTPRSAEDDKEFAWLRQLMEWQRDLKDPTEFIETVKIDLFQDEVFVFTPKGDVKALPKGATPDRLRVRDPLAGRRALLGRARQRPDRAAALRAPQRRHRRDPHVGEPEAVQGLAQVRRHEPGARRRSGTSSGWSSASAAASSAAISSGASCASSDFSLATRRARRVARERGRAAAARQRRRSAGRGRLRQGQPRARRRRRPHRSSRSGGAEAPTAPAACETPAAARRPPAKRSIGGIRVAGRGGHPGQVRQVLQPGPRRPDRRLHQPRPRRRHPHPRLPEGARPRSRPPRRRRVGRRVARRCARSRSR